MTKDKKDTNDKIVIKFGTNHKSYEVLQNSRNTEVKLKKNCIF